MSDNDIVRGVVARLGEHFDDYVVIVRTKDNKIAFVPSDMTWAMGACNRFLNYACEAQEVSDGDAGNSAGDN